MTRLCLTVVLVAGCMPSNLRPIDSDEPATDATDASDDTDVIVQPECPVLDAASEPVETLTVCERPVPLSAPRLKWSVELPYRRIERIRAGPIRDLDGSGVVDVADPSTIVVTFREGPDNEQGGLLLDGRDGSVIETHPYFMPSALVRRPGSDQPEVWGSYGASAARLSGDGVVADFPGVVGGDLIVPTDIDHDGHVELVHNSAVIRVDPPRVLFSESFVLPTVFPTSWDLDDDGHDTVILGDGLVLERNRELCRKEVTGPVVGTRQADGSPLLVRIVDGSMRIGPDPCVDGEPLSLGFPDGWSRLGAVGDLDGDGEVEVVIHEYTPGALLDPNLVARELTGKERWRTTVPGDHYGQPALADLDGDGAFEVVSSGPAVYSGETGERLFPLGEPDRTARVIDEVVPVDVDGDNQLEIVVVRTGGLDVWEGEDGWAPGPRVWHSSSFWAGGIEPDLSVPQDPVWPWEGDGSFRAATGHGPALGAGSDLAVRIARVCEEECAEGVVYVGIQAGNLGARAVVRPTELRLEVRRGGEWEVAHVQTYETLPAGEWLDGIDVAVEVEPAIEDIRVSLEPVGWRLLRECDGAASTVTYGSPPCE